MRLIIIKILKYVCKQDETLLFVVENTETYPIIICKLDILGDLIAIPTGRATIVISFKRKAKDPEQVVSDVVGVYTIGRSNYHVIIAENAGVLTK